MTDTRLLVYRGNSPTSELKSARLSNYKSPERSEYPEDSSCAEFLLCGGFALYPEDSSCAEFVGWASTGCFRFSLAGGSVLCLSWGPWARWRRDWRTHVFYLACSAHQGPHGPHGPHGPLVNQPAGGCRGQAHVGLDARESLHPRMLAWDDGPE
jgi:hypothetical protein